MNRPGGQIAQGDKDEGALVKERMGENQIRGPADFFAVEKDVHVKGARSPRHVAPPPEAGFHIETEMQQVPGREFRLHFQNGIEIRPLPLWASDGVRFVKG